MITWHGIIFKEIGFFWKNLRRFAFYNRTIFELFFIFLYVIEQIILVWLAFHVKSIEELGLIISIFAIIVLTTFALHKLLMESRIKVLENEVKELQMKKFLFEEELSNIKEISHDLYEKVLNIKGVFKDKKRLEK